MTQPQTQSTGTLSPETPTARPLAYPLILCYASMLSLAIGSNLLPVLLKTLSDSLESPLNYEQLGRIPAVTFAGLAMAIFITGPLADRLGGKVFAIGGNLCVAAGLVLLGRAHTYLAVLLAAWVMGLGAGILDMILSPVVSALRPNHRTSALNLLHGFYGLGAVGTILFASWALQSRWDWRFAAYGLLILPSLFAIALLFASMPPLVADENQRQGLRQLFPQRWYQLALVAGFLAGATELGIGQWTAGYAEKSLGYSAWGAAMAYAAFCLAMTVGRMGIGLAGTRITPRQVLIPCAISSIILIIATCLIPSPALAISMIIAAGLTTSCLWPSTIALTADRYPHGGASMFALLTAGANTGGIIMPWALGLIASKSSLTWGLSSVALCPIGLLLILHAMKRSAENPRHKGV